MSDPPEAAPQDEPCRWCEASRSGTCKRHRKKEEDPELTALRDALERQGQLVRDAERLLRQRLETRNQTMRRLYHLGMKATELGRVAGIQRQLAHRIASWGESR